MLFELRATLRRDGDIYNAPGEVFVFVLTLSNKFPRSNTSLSMQVVIVNGEMYNMYQVQIHQYSLNVLYLKKKKKMSKRNLH